MTSVAKAVDHRLNMLANRSVRYTIPPVADEEIEALQRGAAEIETLRDEAKTLSQRMVEPLPNRRRHDLPGFEPR